MHPFAQYVMRAYNRETGWNEDNLYSHFTRSSNAILDFAVPRGLHLTLSKSPNPLFKTSYSMNAMPSLNGSVGYVFTSCNLDVQASRNARFKDTLEHFKVYDQPRRPEGKEETWLAGERVSTSDYLLYGRLFLPTGQLDAVYSTRISPTMQFVVQAISDPPSHIPRPKGSDSSNVVLSLEHDVGKWGTEYTWSAEDAMWGVRVLHNFGKLGEQTEENRDKGLRPKRIDEEDAVEGGLKGRVSAGAEIYFSAKEKSAGVSTGIRFTTLPDATPPSFQLDAVNSTPTVRNTASQPPTTITALFNPMLGHISTAYSARVSRDLSLSSRFEFNMYSYESQWTMGGELWIRRSPSNEETDPSTPQPDSVKLPSPVHGVVKAKASTNNDMSLMWEGRVQNMLVGLGVVSNFTNRSKPIKTIGLELSYFSSD